MILEALRSATNNLLDPENIRYGCATEKTWPLHRAVIDNNVGKVRELLAQGHDVNAWNDCHYTPLTVLCKANNSRATEEQIRQTEMFKTLVNNGASDARICFLGHTCYDYLADETTALKRDVAFFDKMSRTVLLGISYARIQACVNAVKYAIFAIAYPQQREYYRHVFLTNNFHAKLDYANRHGYVVYPD